LIYNILSVKKNFLPSYVEPSLVLREGSPVPLI